MVQLASLKAKTLALQLDSVSMREHLPIIVDNMAAALGEMCQIHLDLKEAVAAMPKVKDAEPAQAAKRN
jgi:hypothetical protein